MKLSTFGIALLLLIALAGLARFTGTHSPSASAITPGFTQSDRP